MRLVSIDPGITGALVLLIGGVPQDFKVMPTEKVGSKTMVDPRSVTHMLKLWEPTQVVIERVGASPRAGVSSMFNFGFGAGVLHGTCAGLSLPCTTISPQRWKTYFGLIGKNKDAARLKVIQMFPSKAREFKFKKDVDKADATLLGLAWMELNT